MLVDLVCVYEYICCSAKYVYRSMYVAILSVCIRVYEYICCSFKCVYRSIYVGRFSVCIRVCMLLS